MNKYKLVALIACSYVNLPSKALEVYSIDPKLEFAKVTVPANFINWICINGVKKLMPLVESDKILVPAGERITLGVDVSVHEYYGKSSCSPRISFIPDSGKSYFMNLHIEAEKCTNLIYLVTNKNRIGLDFEKSIDRGQFCQAN